MSDKALIYYLHCSIIYIVLDYNRQFSQSCTMHYIFKEDCRQLIKKLTISRGKYEKWKSGQKGKVYDTAFKRKSD